MKTSNKMTIQIGTEKYRIYQETDIPNLPITGGPNFVIDYAENGDSVTAHTYKTAGAALDWLVAFVKNHSEEL